MENILSFLADNHKWFLGAAVLLLFALIGFIVDGKKKKKTDEVVPNTNGPVQGQTPATEQAVMPKQNTNLNQTVETLDSNVPTLDNVAPAKTELNLEQGSIFETPETQVQTETTPLGNEQPIETQAEEATLVIEDKEETPQMQASEELQPTITEPQTLVTEQPVETKVEGPVMETTNEQTVVETPSETETIPQMQPVSMPETPQVNTPTTPNETVQQ